MEIVETTLGFTEKKKNNWTFHVYRGYLKISKVYHWYHENKSFYRYFYTATFDFETRHAFLIRRKTAASQYFRTDN